MGVFLVKLVEAYVEISFPLGLIDTLYDQNGQHALSHGSNRKRKVRAKRLIREIQVALKNS